MRIRVEYEQYEDFCQWIDELRSGHNNLWFMPRIPEKGYKKNPLLMKENLLND